MIRVTSKLHPYLYLPPTTGEEVSARQLNRIQTETSIDHDANSLNTARQGAPSEPASFTGGQKSS
jgi:hypothetical protein